MFERTTKPIVTAAAAAALSLALGGAALASPMGAGAMGGGAHAGDWGSGGVHMDTDGLTPGGYAPGTHMDDPDGTYGPGTHGGIMDSVDGTYGPGTHADATDGSYGPGPHGPGHMFTDVTDGEWYHEYAEQMAGHGFMGGFGDGTFGGEHAITRGQFAGIMARMMGLEAADAASFTDTAGFWGAGAIGALARHGIVAGYADGSFGPYDDITRAQMAAMMARAWEWMELNGAGPGTDDADMARLREQMRERLHDVDGNWAEDHIAHMFGLGVIQGDQNGMFRPQATTTRAQASAMMWRWYEALEQ